MYMLVNLGTQEHKFNTKLDLYIYIFFFLLTKSYCHVMNLLLSLQHEKYIGSTVKH